MVLNCFRFQLLVKKKLHISLKLLLNFTHKHSQKCERFPRSDEAIGIGFWILVENVTNAHALIVPLCVNISTNIISDDKNVLDTFRIEAFPQKTKSKNSINCNFYDRRRLSWYFSTSAMHTHISYYPQYISMQCMRH